MKNSKLRRILLTLACAVLLVSLSVGATLAYLTSTTEVVENTFTVGKVKILLDEARVNVYGEWIQTLASGEEGVPDFENIVNTREEADRVMANTYKLLPGHNYPKDPTVHVVVGSEPCYLYVKIDNQIANIEADPKIAKQMNDNGWYQLQDLDGNDVPGVFYYKDIVDARTEVKNVIVFEEFTVVGNITNDALAAYENKNITVRAYAVQADGFDDAEAAYAAAPCTWGAN